VRHKPELPDLTDPFESGTLLCESPPDATRALSKAKCWSECWSNPGLTPKEEAAAIESGRPVAFKLSHSDHAVFGPFRALTLTCAPVRLNLLQGLFPSPARAALPYTPVAAGSSKLDQKGGRSLMPCFQWSPLMLCQCLIRPQSKGLDQRPLGRLRPRSSSVNPACSRSSSAWILACVTSGNSVLQSC
jgi:hypothetical protein